MKFQILAFIKGLMQRDRHVFVSMTASGLEVALYELGFRGWREAAFVHVPLDALGEDLATVSAGLQKVIEGWHLQPQTHVSWVLPPDIVGVVHNKTAAGDGPELDQVFPFSRDHILLSKALNGRDLCSSILWVHKDWVGVFQRISQEAGLHCCELFARAQLFEMSLSLSANGHGVLIEDVRGEFFLHIFKGNHGVIRSKSLGKDRSVLLDSALERELAGVGSDDAHIYVASTDQMVFLQQRERSVGKSFSRLSLKTPSETLLGLALSVQQGIELGATETRVVKRIAMTSILAVGLLLVALILVLWRNDELQTQIAQGRASVRKDLVAYEDAKALRVQAVRYAKVIELRDQFTNQPESFRMLASVLGALGPNASIHYFSQDGANIRIAGGIDPIRNTTISFQNTAYFRDLREIDPRSIKEAPKATFARSFVWNDLSSASADARSEAKAP